MLWDTMRDSTGLRTSPQLPRPSGTWGSPGSASALPIQLAVCKASVAFATSFFGPYRAIPMRSRSAPANLLTAARLSSSFIVWSISAEYTPTRTPLALARSRVRASAARSPDKITIGCRTSGRYCVPSASAYGSPTIAASAAGRPRSQVLAYGDYDFCIIFHLRNFSPR